jgi:hypothetical protein
MEIAEYIIQIINRMQTMIGRKNDICYLFWKSTFWNL